MPMGSGVNAASPAAFCRSCQLMDAMLWLSLLAQVNGQGGRRGRGGQLALAADLGEDLADVRVVDVGAEELLRQPVAGLEAGEVAAEEPSGLRAVLADDDVEVAACVDVVRQGGRE